MTTDQRHRIPGFRLLRLLGRGGMGEVYLAEQEALGREVALKILRADQTSDQVRARFQREAQVMVGLQHPNVIRFFDHGEVEGQLWLAMERIQGKPLDRILHEQGAIRPVLARQIMDQVGSALQALHDDGILHRDVKPGNIMVEASGRVILMDLGLALDPGQTHLTKTGHILGTPVYLAPEVFEGESFEPSVDWYAWALTWWELLEGRRPFDIKEIFANIGTSRCLEVERPGSRHGPVDPLEAETIVRCLGPRVRRPGSWHAIGRLLRGEGEEDATCQLAPGEDPNPTPRPGPGARGAASSSRAGRSRRAWVAAVTTSLVISLVGIGVLLWPRGEDPSVETPTGPPGAAAGGTGPVLVERGRFRDARSLVWVGEAPDPLAVRATWQLEDHSRPVPVYAAGEGRVAVWAVGLPGRSPGTLRIQVGAGRERPLEIDLAETGLPDPQVPLPSFLRPYLGELAKPELEAYLDVVWSAVGGERRLDSELDLLGGQGPGIDPFGNVPPRAWSTLVAWIREGGLLGVNLLETLEWGRAIPPPVVAWALFHEYGNPRTALFDPALPEYSAWLPGMDVYQFPPPAFERLREWAEVRPEATRAVLRGLERLTRAWVKERGRRTLSLPHLAGQERRSLAAVGWEPFELVELTREAATGSEESLELLLARSRRRGLEGLFATALLGATDQEELVPELLDRFGHAGVPEVYAVDIALDGLRTRSGFWNESRGSMLLRETFDDFPVLRAIPGEGARVVYQPQLRVLYGWFPERVGRVVLEGPEGQRAVLRASITLGFRQEEAEGDAER